MKPIDFFSGNLTTKAMIPEKDEELTFLWGRKVVRNIIGALGIIGTINVPDSAVWNAPYEETIPLNLTKIFTVPPKPFFYLQDSDPSAGYKLCDSEMDVWVIGDNLMLKFYQGGKYVYRLWGN